MASKSYNITSLEDIAAMYKDIYKEEDYTVAVAGNRKTFRNFFDKKGIKLNCENRENYKNFENCTIEYCKNIFGEKTMVFIFQTMADWDVNNLGGNTLVPIGDIYITTYSESHEFWENMFNIFKVDGYQIKKENN
jgi:tRNA(Met) C34 N-acetyltransferase TmcA